MGYVYIGGATLSLSSSFPVSESFGFTTYTGIQQGDLLVLCLRVNGTWDTTPGDKWQWSGWPTAGDTGFTDSLGAALSPLSSAVYTGALSGTQQMPLLVAAIFPAGGSDTLTVSIPAPAQGPSSCGLTLQAGIWRIGIPPQALMTSPVIFVGQNDTQLDSPNPTASVAGSIAGIPYFTVGLVAPGSGAPTPTILDSPSTSWITALRPFLSRIGGIVDQVRQGPTDGMSIATPSGISFIVAVQPNAPIVYQSVYLPLTGTTAFPPASTPAGGGGVNFIY